MCIHIHIYIYTQNHICVYICAYLTYIHTHVCISPAVVVAAATGFRASVGKISQKSALYLFHMVTCLARRLLRNFTCCMSF